MFAAPMLRHSLTTPGDMKILDMLDLSAARGTGLVKQILAFAHSSTGDPRSTQIKHLACDIINLIEGTFPKSIQLNRRIQTDLWPVMANPTQIHQVLLNLCVNARDAMPNGGTLSISATNHRFTAEQAGTFPGARPGAWIVIEVTDTGTGIAPGVLAHIWEPFYTTKGPGKGTGLGLYTVRAIVTSHHGHVELDTFSGRGTTFRVFLPAVESESCEAVAMSAVDVPTGQSELILVVDDDRAVRELIVTILEKHGFRVLGASNGVEAVTHFTAHATEIVLVITDVEMPLFSGTVLARVLLQLRPDLRLLAISGRSSNSQDGTEVHAAEQLMHAFLLKPFTPEDLLSTVNRLIHPGPKV
jgi:CheY-like chemotaxis protein